jgi:hypothetical protein
MQQVSQVGYRHLGDVVDKTIEEVMHVSPVLRITVSGDGRTVVAFYHFLTGKGPTDRQLRIFDVQTEFTDGTFLTTSNSEGADMMTPPAEIHRQQFALDTPLAELLQAHETERQRLLALKEGVSCVIISSREDAIESEKRLQVARIAFRTRIGYVEPAEVSQIAMARTNNREVAKRWARLVERAKETMDDSET